MKRTLTTVLAATVFCGLGIQTATAEKSKRADGLYFQIESLKAVKGQLKLGGYWAMPSNVTLQSGGDNKKPPKIPSFPKPPVYILPPCDSELSEYMDDMMDQLDEQAGNEPGVSESDIDGHKNWCDRLEASLGAMGVETIGHDDFY